MSGDQSQYVFWTPPPGRSVEVGAERHAFLLPAIPLPILASKAAVGEPDAALIGQSLYDYLRQFPDCRHNRDYALLLRDAFPHYLADLASQALMLREKDVAGPYLGRMISSLKIFVLLEPDNLELQMQLGVACFDRALMFEELPACRSHLLEAMSCLQRVCRGDDANLAAHSYLGQVDYLFGDYPSARRHWLKVAAALGSGNGSTRLRAKLRLIDGSAVPETSLVDALEAVGLAMLSAAEHDWPMARNHLEQALANAWLLLDFASPQLHYLQGLCLRYTGDAPGAAAALRRALELDADYEPARAELALLNSEGV